MVRYRTRSRATSHRVSAALPPRRRGNTFAAISPMTVIDNDRYKTVAGQESSAWTKRVTGRTKVYRSVGRQIFPGRAITVSSARVTIVRCRELAETDGPAVVEAMREAFESRPSTLQVRVFAYHVGGKVDFLGFVSSSVPDDSEIKAKVFGKLAGAIDLFNSYVPL